MPELSVPGRRVELRELGQAVSALNRMMWTVQLVSLGVALIGSIFVLWWLVNHRHELEGLQVGLKGLQVELKGLQVELKGLQAVGAAGVAADELNRQRANRGDRQR